MSEVVYLPQKLNDANDAAIGGGTSPVFTRGLLGQIIELSARDAAKHSNTAIGTLYEGAYQYVKFKAGSTASNARGQVVVWDDEDDFVVTPDVTAATIGKKAGVVLCTVDKGNYGWIQISGRATVKCKATVTTTTAGNVAVVDQTPGNTVDAIADATAVTHLLAKSAIGVFVEAPSNGGLKQVQLSGLFENFRK